MIAHVSGVVVEKFNSSVIVDVNGVGYEIQVATGDFDETLLNSNVKFYTYHHVREQSEELFGFSSLMAKKIFELLITVQGVGPKAALAILSLSNTESVRSAIANGDVAYITKASGVGKKTAERVAVDLSDKVGAATHSYGMALNKSADANNSDEALEALMALGYNITDASKALDGIPEGLRVSERVMRALKGDK